MVTQDATLQALLERARVLEQQAKNLRRAVLRLSRGRSVELENYPDGDLPTDYSSASQEVLDTENLAEQVALYLRDRNMIPTPQPLPMAKTDETQSGKVDLDLVTNLVAEKLAERVIPSAGVSSAPIDINAVVEIVLTKVRDKVLSSPELSRLIQKAIKDLDLEDLQDRVYEDVDAEEMHSALAEHLADRIFKKILIPKRSQASLPVSGSRTTVSMRRRFRQKSRTQSPGVLGSSSV